MSAEAPSPSPAVQKALTKLDASLAAGQGYEGHELFKTVFHRFRARKQLADSYALAEGGAVRQLGGGALNAGTELGCMLADAYTTDAAPADDANVQRVLRVLGAFPTAPTGDDDDPPVESCSKVASAAVKWLKTVNGLQRAPALFAALADYITRSLAPHGLGVAMPHYARSDDLTAFARAVAAAVAAAPSSEEDLFVARAALTVAATPPVYRGATTSLMRAREVLAAYPGAAGHAVPDTPLCHFVTLFLDALERRAPALVDLLLEKYKGSLQRDPSLGELVDRAREAWAPRPVAPAGLFGDLFRSMMLPA